VNKDFEIKSIKAREILDSRGEPTVEVELTTNFGVFKASVPSGASKGKYEAKELRDGGKRYGGRGVLKAVRNVNKRIFPKIRGRNVENQEKIDQFLIELDGAKNKDNLGANALLPVSMAVCRAGAQAKNIPLYRYISQLFGQKISKTNFPNPCFNLINGGAHAGNDLEIQEFMISPQIADYKKSLQAASEIYHSLKKILVKKLGKKSINIGDEGGFAPPLNRTKTALNLLVEAIKLAGYSNKVKIALDCAASQFLAGTRANLFYVFENKRLNRSRLLELYQDLIKHYPICSLEDPFAENDFKGFQEAYEKLAREILIIGDDLLVTNKDRMKKAFEEKLCNGLLLKINQIGTITEALQAARLARTFGWKIMVSHRSGETCDDFISDLAVGISADFIKAGAPTRGERVAKYNRLLEIEEELK
jgi:enolase